ncbi:NAD-dependent protein deacetylase [Maioricimonas rarisocia]|uniref:protein acetyllysine N-acetyltransferase n=1 Tax=Maioricimonas rarisocia TaxID=2528026 RepID=A0A517Z9R7_9PLAN|nr:NAD-dependent deacylase [Maioricimonas rarisocia]QDU39225.1 NAD-dependent protein deacetylase [Maioricimonas rarisocia]
MQQEKIRQVADWIQQAQRAVAFTGAGISTESGIPDFRSPGGVWATSQPVYYEDYLSNPAARAEYWRQKSLTHDEFLKANPNVAHRLLAAWEQRGRIRGVITQNIDGLHQEAGSRRVWELHGTARQIGCLECDSRFDADPLVRQFLESKEVPPCPDCGGLIKHATISFGQALPSHVLEESIQLADEADLFLVFGSSLVVEPAASLPVMAHRAGAKLVIINRDATHLDGIADIVFNDAIGDVASAIAELTGDPVEA